MNKMKPCGCILWLALLFVAASPVQAQYRSFRWQRNAMDSTWERPQPNRADSILMQYYPGIEPLMEIVGYTDCEMDRYRPESGLSNLAADIILDAAGPYLEPGDRAVSLTNFGGIRAPLPKGAVRIYDLYSIFPFENTIVIAEVKGRDLRRQLERFAEWNSFEALGGLRLEVRDGRIVRCEVQGEPLEDDRIYKLATIDFLLGGGDKVFIGSCARNVVRTGIVVRDAVVAYFRKETEAGRTVGDRKDGRVHVAETERRNGK